MEPASFPDLLAPWHPGRTAVGVSGLDGDGVEQMAAVLAAVASGAAPALPAGAKATMPALISFLADDLKTYYFEAAAARPAAHTPPPVELNRWLFAETALGELLCAGRDRLLASEDRSTAALGRFRLQLGMFSNAAFGRRASFAQLSTSPRVASTARV